MKKNDNKFQPYWIETGNSLPLLELAKDNNFDFSTELEKPISEDSLNYFSLDDVDLCALLFQSGYFTIKGLEIWVAGGIIDNTVTIGDKVYIFEFKIAKTADAALKQIHQKNYAARWKNDNKKIIHFALAFDTKKKCVSDYKIEEL